MSCIRFVCVCKSDNVNKVPSLICLQVSEHVWLELQSANGVRRRVDGKLLDIPSGCSISSICLYQSECFEEFVIKGLALKASGGRFGRTVRVLNS